MEQTLKLYRRGHTFYPEDHEYFITLLEHFSGGMIAVGAETKEKVVAVAALHGWKVEVVEE